MSPLFGFGSREDRAPEVRWVVAHVAWNQPEAELHAARLAELEIPAWVRRTAAMDVPDMLAGGMREILVPEEFADQARELFEPEDGE